MKKIFFQGHKIIWNDNLYLTIYFSILKIEENSFLILIV